MKNQALFFSKDKTKTFKCCLLQFLFGPLRVNPFALETFKWLSCTTQVLILSTVKMTLQISCLKQVFDK